MRIRVILLATLFFGKIGLGQFQKFEGNWISEKNEMLSIQDFEESNNYITNYQSFNDNFYFEVYGDTLSFQSKYYTSADDYKKLIIDRYDLKVVSFSDSLITVRPVTKFATNFLKTNKPITFVNQNYITNPEFKLEKLIFTTSSCYGSCPVLKLRITNEGDMELSAQYFDNGGYFIDEKRSGNFVAQLDKNSYQKLERLLVEAKIGTFDIIPGQWDLCCDGAVKTLITYHNGKRNYIKTMHEPRILRELINYLYDLPELMKLKRVDNDFRFED